MITKSQIKFVKDLHRKRNRQECGLFLVEGVKLWDELRASSLRIHSVYAKEAWVQENQESLQGLNYFACSTKDLERISTLMSPNEVLAVVYTPEYSLPDSPEGWSLVLDGVSDPGNFGTILRTAEWFGLNEIICSQGTVEPWNPKVVQSSMGSVLRVRCLTTDLSTWLNAQRENGRPVYGATLEGQPLKVGENHEPGVLVMGSESHGISSELRSVLTDQILITGRGPTESLNVSVATGILLHALTLQ